MRDELVTLLEKLVGELTSKLPGEAIHLKASTLGAASEEPLTGSIVSDAVKQILDQIQASLNYDDAGSLVPLFAKPGGNPDDPNDVFWQHHLGNYWTYLQEQYGE